MTQDKLKRSVRRYRRRSASHRRHVAASIQERSQRTDAVRPVYRRGTIRGYSRPVSLARRPTRQELRHWEDWQESQIDMDLS